MNAYSVVVLLRPDDMLTKCTACYGRLVFFDVQNVTFTWKERAKERCRAGGQWSMVWLWCAGKVLGFLCSEVYVCGTLVTNATLKQRTTQATAQQSVARIKTPFIQIIKII